MCNKTITTGVFTILAAFIITISTSITALGQDQGFVELQVKKIGDVWKVVDSDNNTTIKVKPNYKVSWRSSESELVFQFPDAYSKYFRGASEDDQLGTGNTKRLKKNQKLNFIVKGDAPEGEVVYSVFVLKDGVYAEGNSPTVIIIEY